MRTCCCSFPYPSTRTFLCAQSLWAKATTSPLLSPPFFPPSSTPAISPTNINFKFLSKRSPTSPKSPSQYNQLIRSLLWVSQCTRPNILFAVNKLSQFLQDPSLDHWNAAIQILQYLNATKHFCLTLGGNDLELVGYSDSDWAEDRDNRRSISGYTFRLGLGAISWKSQKQQSVSLSSSKAKYKALSESCKEGLWLRNVLCELRLQGDAPVKIFVDNKGEEALAKNPKNHSPTKHINVRHHFIRKCVSRQAFKIHHVSTKDMIADMLTKPLPRVLLNTHQHLFGISGIGQQGGVLE